MSLVVALVICGGLALAIASWPSPHGKLATICFFLALLVFVGALTGAGGLHLR